MWTCVWYFVCTWILPMRCGIDTWGSLRAQSKEHLNHLRYSGKGRKMMTARRIKWGVEVPQTCGKSIPGNENSTLKGSEMSENMAYSFTHSFYKYFWGAYYVLTMLGELLLLQPTRWCFFWTVSCCCAMYSIFVKWLHVKRWQWLSIDSLYSSCKGHKNQ